VDRLTETAKKLVSYYTKFIYHTINFISMSQIRILMALAIIGALFLFVGAQTMVYAQMSNDTSMMGNATWAGNATNATGMGNETGNISGLQP
jgi:hypothetical protein